MASLTVYQIKISNNNKSYTIKLTNAILIWEAYNIKSGLIDISCTYYYLDDYTILYKHAITVL